MTGRLMFLVCAGLCAAMPMTAHAQVRGEDRDVTKAFSKAYHDCELYGERNNKTAIPQRVCAQRELTVQDARLNQAWKMVMTRLPAKRKADLRVDERNWISARDAKCRDKGDEKPTCLAYETVKRVRYLERVR